MSLITASGGFSPEGREVLDRPLQHRRRGLPALVSVLLGVGVAAAFRRMRVETRRQLS